MLYIPFSVKIISEFFDDIVRVYNENRRLIGLITNIIENWYSE